MVVTPVVVICLTGTYRHRSNNLRWQACLARHLLRPRTWTPDVRWSSFPAIAPRLLSWKQWLSPVRIGPCDDLRRNWGAVCAALPQVAPAAGTLIIGFDSHFLGYRHAGYSLPDYATVEYPEERLNEGVRVFAMHCRNTQLLAALPTGSYTRFVLLPLPYGSDSYRDYVKKVRRKPLVPDCNRFE
jgi:hypothetical protein